MNYGHTQIENVPVYNMGSNNYTNGMLAIIFNPKDITVDAVKALPNVFLSPLAEPNSQEIFAMYGTAEQYAAFKQAEFEGYAAKKAFAQVGGIPANDDREAWDKMQSIQEEILSTIKCWYEN